MGRPRRLTDRERKASGAERQRRYKARHGWVARQRQKESMRALRARRKEASGVITAPVNNRKPFRDDGLLPLGELHYGPVEGYDTSMEPKPNGGPRPVELKEASHVETANERSTYAQLERFKERRAQMEAGVQVELIL
jgi:hypothetical protein